MPTITLPDGSTKQFAQPVTTLEIANSIGAGLYRATLAAVVNDQLVDATKLISEDATVRIITAKDPQGLDVIRHSTAHLLAQAVQELFPSAQVTIGPVIEHGFYYDFAFERPFTPDDLIQIEQVMQKIVQADLPVTRKTLGRDEAIAFFRNIGEEYKAKIIADIPSTEVLSLYSQGEFTDLCRGPHVPRTGILGAFKLTKLAGAYWRGDPKNEMLQRIYGTAWGNQKELQAHLDRLAEAEKRDHRKIGKALDLFHVQQEAPGMVFWHAKGWAIYQAVQNHIRQALATRGYQEVNTPQLVDRSLWEKSGHWDKFQQNMFTTSTENRDYAVKPMNCPCHIQIFNQGLRSHHDLPIRLAEFGNCHRCEPSGTLHGIMRVRNFVQDDAHIFCTENQIQSEVSDFIDLLYAVYADFGFNNVIVKLSTRPEQRVGSDEIWDQAESALADVLKHKNLEYQLCPGEGAFYGPKIEFALQDCLERIWQCGTVQLDFSMPGRLDASYVAEDGSRKVPVMIHRAILGSLERFIGILLEEYAGHLPVWLAPQQAVVCNITSSQLGYVQEVTQALQKSGFRAISDLRNEKIGFKIREHTLQRIPYILVVGDREVTEKQIAVRTQSGQDLGVMSVQDFCDKLNADIASKGR